MAATPATEPLISEEEWERRKAFVGFGREDEAVLRELSLVARTYADAVMDELYSRWLKWPELRRLLPDDAAVARVKRLQRDYFLSLTAGRYGADYLAHRLRVGEAHQRIGLDPRWFLGAYAIYLELVLPRVLDAFEYDRVKQRRAVAALTKLISLDQEVALLAYFRAPG